MLAFDLETGATAWKRQLGAIAIHPPIPAGPEEYLLVDAFAGVYRVGNTAAPERDPILSTDTLSPPTDGASGPARVAVSPDGKDVWTILTVAASDGTKLKFQKFSAGKSVGFAEVPVPDQLAGAPLAFGAHLLVPLANGFVYRISVGDTASKKGSIWRGPTVRGATACHLSAAGADEYLASDGNADVGLYSWPTGAEEATRIAGPWNARGKISLPAIRIDSGGANLVITGTETGTVSSFDSARPLRDPIRTWRGSAKGPFPEGAVASPFTTFERDGGIRLVYSVKNESLICLNPDADAPDWVVPAPGADAGELLGVLRDGDKLLVSYQSGLVQALDAKTGRVAEETESDRPPADVAAIRFGPGRLLQSNADGTVGLSTIVPLVIVK